MENRQYYIFTDGEQRGPYELDKLIEAGVRPSTYVWCKTMDDWERADSVEEIRELFRRHLKRVKENGREPQEVQPAAVVTPVPFQPDATRHETEEERPQRFPFPADVESEPDYNRPPQVSMTLAVLSLLLCFPPAGIAAVVFAYKAQKSWEQSLKPGASDVEELRKKAHEYERLAKMWLGLTVALGIIAWTLIFSLPKN